MAVTQEGAALTEAHRLALARIGQRATVDIHKAWRLLDPFDLDGTVAAWLEATLPIVESYHGQAVRLADAYYRGFRRAELLALGALGEAAAATTLEAAPVVMDATMVSKSLVVTGPVAIKAGTARGLSVDDLVRIARQASALSGSRHATNGGRDAVMRSMRADKAALGYARTAAGSACSFCAMLASRGPVYEKSTASFRAHDGCSCAAEPVYTRQAAWPPGSRDWEGQWQLAKATSAEAGVSTATQFRRLHEGRTQ